MKNLDAIALKLIFNGEGRHDKFPYLAAFGALEGDEGDFAIDYMMALNNLIKWQNRRKLNRRRPVSFSGVAHPFKRLKLLPKNHEQALYKNRR
jgi:hypothetical protein